MKTQIVREELPALFEAVQLAFDAQEAELCAMDAKMGDGDLGLTMKRGFGSVPEFLQKSEEKAIDKVLIKAGMNMASVAPSTMGTLMASGLMQAGKLLKDVPAIDAAAFSKFLFGYAEGIMKRGKCIRGQRTVLDSIGPAADAVAEAVHASEISLADAAAIALEYAKKGTQETANMLPVYGKAAVHQNIAKGIIDQGAYAGQCLIQGFYNYICT